MLTPTFAGKSSQKARRHSAEQFFFSDLKESTLSFLPLIKVNNEGLSKPALNQKLGVGVLITLVIVLFFWIGHPYAKGSNATSATNIVPIYSVNFIHPPIPNGVETQYIINPNLSSTIFPNNVVIDEIYLKIVFAGGVTNLANRLVMVNVSNCLGTPIPSLKFHSKVVGQTLYTSYGFTDKEAETICLNPTALAQDVTFTVAGNNPVTSASYEITYHRQGADLQGNALMPDLYGLSGNLPFPGENRLFSSPIEANNTIPSFGPLLSATAKKVVVFVHGWNPNGNMNHYAPSPANITNPLETKWKDLYSALRTSLPVGWNLARYDWGQDASTGPIINNTPPWLHPTNPLNARSAAIAHGLKLGKQLSSDGINLRALTHVHFLAHSAGSWAARRAAEYLRWKFPNITIQITFLDPYVPPISGQHFELMSSWANDIENYYVYSDITGGATRGIFGVAKVNVQLDSNPPVPSYDSTLQDHGGPVAWYARTVRHPILGTTPVIGYERSLANGLVAYYPFDGNANDASGNGHNGVETAITYASGSVGQAATFNGMTSQIDVPQSASIKPVNTMTVSTWVRYNGVPADWATNKLISNSVLTSPYSGFWMDVVPANIIGSSFTSSDIMKPRFFLANQTGSTQIYASTPLTVGVWHHIAGVYSATRKEIYIDGVLAVDTALTNTWTTGTGGVRYGNTPTMQVGHWGASHFNGALDDVRIYNRALSAAEIAQLAGANQPPNPANGLVAYYPFNGNANDASGNGNHATIMGAATFVAGATDQAIYINNPSGFGTITQYVALPNSTSITSLNQSSFTVHMCYKTTDSAQNNGRLFGNMTGIVIDYNAGAKAGAYSGVKNRGVFTMVALNQTVNASTVVTDGVMHCEAVIVDRANSLLQQYIDGQLKDSVSIVGIGPIPMNNLVLGATKLGDNAGARLTTIDDLRIYNRALSASEVGQLAGRSIGISLNAPTFTVGSTMTLTGTTVASTPTTRADIYYALQLPDSTLLIMQPGGAVSTAVTPFQANVTVPSATSQLFNYTLSGLEPVGNYTWFAALMQPGTMNMIGTIATATFTITAPPPPPPPPSTLTGNWIGTWISTAFPGQGGSLTIALTQTGAALSGSGTATGTIGGTVQGALTGIKNGTAVSFGVAVSAGQSVQYNGTVNATLTSMSGTYTFPATGDQGTWTVIR